jgi:hypothetical protein
VKSDDPRLEDDGPNLAYFSIMRTVLTAMVSIALVAPPAVGYAARSAEKATKTKGTRDYSLSEEGRSSLSSMGRVHGAFWPRANGKFMTYAAMSERLRTSSEAVSQRLERHFQSGLAADKPNWQNNYEKLTELLTWKDSDFRETSAINAWIRINQHGHASVLHLPIDTSPRIERSLELWITAGKTVDLDLWYRGELFELSRQDLPWRGSLFRGALSARMKELLDSVTPAELGRRLAQGFAEQSKRTSGDLATLIARTSSQSRPKVSSK